MKNKLFFVFIFCICMIFSFSFAECQHSFETSEVECGYHNVKCTMCGITEIHSPDGKWIFDENGENHIFNCDVKGCSYTYNGSHTGGSHGNGGMCTICGEIYQTHGLNVENIKFDDTYHWYECSYNGCEHIYDKEEHTKTKYVESDATYHWYRCKLTDCPYKFESQKHYGGNQNDGYCELELCNRAYLAKLQINEYDYLEYNVGDKDKLTATFVPKEIEVPKVESGYKWKSSMPEVVTVDKEGNIETLREGIAVISVTYGKYSASCTVVVGDLEFAVEPTEYNLKVNEQGTGEINVTYKEKSKNININEYVDFDAFKWDKNILKVSIKREKENKILFKAINESSDVVNVNIWLNNKLKVIEEKVEKSLKYKTTYYCKEELQYLKQQIEKKDNEFSDEELAKFEDKIKKEEIKLRDELYRIKKYIKVSIYIIPSETGSGQTPGQTPGQTSGQTPGQTPGQTSGQTPGQTPGQNVSPKPETSPEQSSDKKPKQSPGQSSSPEPEKSPEKEEVVEGPGHNPSGPVGGGTGSVNRRHVCNTEGYFPDPDQPESGHLRRCYYPDCEYYKKGIPGTKMEHRYKYNSDKDVEMCIICYYEKGSMIKEPKKVHSRDFGIDVLQSQFFVVKDEVTNVDVIITGVEKDLAIRYGSVYDNNFKWTEGRKDNNCITLKWNIKDEYARESYEVNFEKKDDERIIKVKLKDGYMQPSRTEMDITVENNFGEKRLETVELIKEAPERAQFILRFTGDIVNAVKLGETKEITVLCKSQYGYGDTDRKEIQEYYESKNLVHYEDIEITWEGTGGITATGDSSPDSNGYVKGQITGVSVTDNQPAELVITATAKYENEDLIDEIERVLNRGISVYELDSSESSNGQQVSSGGAGGGSSNKGGALPVAAATMGLVAIGGVAFAVNKMTKR